MTSSADRDDNNDLLFISTTSSADNDDDVADVVDEADDVAVRVGSRRRDVDNDDNGSRQLRHTQLNDRHRKRIMFRMLPCL